MLKEKLFSTRYNQKIVYRSARKYAHIAYDDVPPINIKQQQELERVFFRTKARLLSASILSSDNRDESVKPE